MGESSKHWIWRVWRSLAVALLLLLLVGFTYEEIGRRQDSQHPFRIGRAVDVGGRSLNISCAGSGSPAVILESGGGGYGGYGWRRVQAEVAKFTTVCWYDRAERGGATPHQLHVAAPPSFTIYRNCCSVPRLLVRMCWLVTRSGESMSAYSPQNFLPRSPG